MASDRLNIAVIPGEGIRKEIVPEGLRVLEAAAGEFDIDLAFDTFSFDLGGSADTVTCGKAIAAALVAADPRASRTS